MVSSQKEMTEEPRDKRAGQGHPGVGAAVVLMVGSRV